ncbi:MAG: hypothetical protein Harvfovirus17_24 [Harvfovirus sp.]|uniref:Uncharacterized protein n=1 Tax=Harvfovirus sp. TaxID=2487768 RepID=A0A3G5A1X7_9VIRU|nr:MAG: hypothetical protein Harvfovirus17_24 [Harvfovirus sp.]
MIKDIRVITVKIIVAMATWMRTMRYNGVVKSKQDSAQCSANAQNVTIIEGIVRIKNAPPNSPLCIIYSATDENIVKIKRIFVIIVAGAPFSFNRSSFSEKTINDVISAIIKTLQKNMRRRAFGGTIILYSE